MTVRLLGQQYSFTPQCIVVPTNTRVTFRASSADVVHGFLIQKTNVNLMLVPGYVSMLSARFATPADSNMPCHDIAVPATRGCGRTSGLLTRRSSCGSRGNDGE